MWPTNLFRTVGEICFQTQAAYYCRSRGLTALPGEWDTRAAGIYLGCAHGTPPRQLPPRRLRGALQSPRPAQGRPRGRQVATAPRRLRRRSSGVREGPKFTHCSELRSRKSEDQMHDLGTSPSSFLEKVRLSQQKQPRQEERSLSLWRNCQGPGGSRAKASSGARVKGLAPSRQLSAGHRSPRARFTHRSRSVGPGRPVPSPRTAPASVLLLLPPLRTPSARPGFSHHGPCNPCLPGPWADLPSLKIPMVKP